MYRNIFRAGDVLIPKNVDLHKWSVVACDQYTSQPEYWDDVEEIVHDSPSTYHITFPEIFLNCTDADKRIDAINATMQEYLNKSLFSEINNSFIYVERTLNNAKIRKGLVGVVDLEQYSYLPGSQSPIRATEGTVLERIPPRVRVRENAALELPHIMLLIDDDLKTVIEPLAEKKSEFSPAYSFPLMKDGGHISGFIVDSTEEERILSAIDKLADKKSFREKHGIKDDGKGVFLFAMGDGNHSLATAKECFERIKAKLPREEWAVHPARYALVEVVNIHDTSLEFEPIHRVLFDVNPEDVLKRISEALETDEACNDSLQSFEYICAKKSGKLYIKKPLSNLTVGSLQSVLDLYISETGCQIDYVHGDDVVSRLGRRPNSIAFLLPVMKKSQLFETVIKDGALPRKTFSMGDANDKRFYLEARRIK